MGIANSKMKNRRNEVKLCDKDLRQDELDKAILAWEKRFNKAMGYGYHRGFRCRVDAARGYQQRHVGITAEDDFSVVDLLKLIWFEEYNQCPLCGLSFNSFVRLDAEGLDWEIGHIVPPDKGGHFTKSNLQLLHHRCNQVQWRDEIAFRAEIDGTPFHCYIDLLRDKIRRGEIRRDDPKYKNYVRLMDDLSEGYDPRSSKADPRGARLLSRL